MAQSMHFGNCVGDFFNDKCEAMKKVLVALAFFLTMNTVVEAQKKYDFENLKGSWRNKQGAGLDIVDSNTIYIVYGEQKRKVTDSRADFSKSPVWLDLAVKDSSQANWYPALKFQASLGILITQPNSSYQIAGCPW